MARGRRRYTFGEQQTTMERARKVGSLCAWSHYVACVISDSLDLRHAQALSAFAYHVDVMGSEYTVTYPEDVANIIGCGDELAGAYMRTLKKLGLVQGSAAAGYKPAGLMSEM